MAYERVKERILGDSLDAFVSNTMKLFQQQVDIRNANEESNFFKTVAENGLSLDDQLNYRKEQLKRVSDDPAERKRLRSEIKDLTARVEQNKFSNDYLEKLADASAGISSIDSVISWLQDQKDSATDPDVIVAINKALNDKQSEKFTLTQTLLNNQTKYALEDKSAQVINNQIAKISSARASALLDGNDALASNYDLQLQALMKALNENSIDKDIKNFAVASITGYASARQLLDSYNSKITSAPSTGPVTVGDVTYSSPQEFWKFKRDSYLADNSDKGFFAQLNNEINTDLKVKNSQNNLNSQDIKNAALQYDSLIGRPELTNYAPKITSMKQDSIQTGTDLVAKKILNIYSTNYDLNTAVNNLNALKTVGGNVDDTYSQLLTSGATIKKGAIDSILQNAQKLLQADPNLTPDKALSQAIATGSGVVLSPEQLASKPTEAITSDLAKGAAGSQFSNPDQRLTSPAATALPNQPAPPVVPPAPQVNQTGATPAQPKPAPTLALNKQLDFGVTDPQVRELQRFLNSQGFQVASTGPGSAGSETDYFGPLTQAALQKFQSSKGIVSTGDAASTGYGRLGPQTLSAIRKLLGQ